MGETSSPPVDAAKAKETLSQFLAKVLDQLSISAWLPATALVVSLALIGVMRSQLNDPAKSADVLGKTGQVVLENGWASIGLVLGGTILATMVVQAFQFGAIRLLEGYWGASRAANFVTGLGCRYHIGRRSRLREAQTRVAKQAIAALRCDALDNSKPRTVDRLNLVEAKLFATRQLTVAEEEAVARYRWQDHADPHLVRRWHRVVDAQGLYPRLDHQIMPTKVGNVLRSAEGFYPYRDGEVRGWVLRAYQSMDATLQAQHDASRSRLDLYCSMVLFSVGIAAAGIVALRPHYGGPLLVLGLASTVLNYGAAVSSAAEYGTVLRVIATKCVPSPVVHAPAASVAAIAAP